MNNIFSTIKLGPPFKNKCQSVNWPLSFKNVNARVTVDHGFGGVLPFASFFIKVMFPRNNACFRIIFQKLFERLSWHHLARFSFWLRHWPSSLPETEPQWFGAQGRKKRDSLSPFTGRLYLQLKPNTIRNTLPLFQFLFSLPHMDFLYLLSPLNSKKE